MLSTGLNKQLQDWKKQSQLRVRKILKPSTKHHVTVDTKACLNYCSNDYLGLAHHPKIKEALQKGVAQYGMGSGASALVAGYYDIQHELENQFAEWLGAERALLFSSGYLANLGVMSTLANRSNTILSDKLCHASLQEGIQLSRAKQLRYRHQDLTHLNELANKGNIIVTEGVFSMEGDITPLNKIATIAEKNQLGLVIDDAHGIGVLGNNGRGSCEYHNLPISRLSCLVAPLGKAFNGMGAIVAGSNDTIESLIQFAHSYRYTTATPPAICLGLMQALKLIQTESWRRELLQSHIHYFQKQAKSHGLSLASEDTTPIQAILVGDNSKTLQIQQILFEKGYHISCIRPPTVPKDTARIRISLNCHHTKEDISALIELIHEALHGR